MPGNAYRRDVYCLLRSDAPVRRNLKRQTRLDPAARRIHDAGEERPVGRHTLRAGSGHVHAQALGSLMRIRCPEPMGTSVTVISPWSGPIAVRENA